jgi:hypothetical protein
MSVKLNNYFGCLAQEKQFVPDRSGNPTNVQRTCCSRLKKSSLDKAMDIGQSRLVSQHSNTEVSFRQDQSEAFPGSKTVKKRFTVRHVVLIAACVLGALADGGAGVKVYNPLIIPRLRMQRESDLQNVRKEALNQLCRESAIGFKGLMEKDIHSVSAKVEHEDNYICNIQLVTQAAGMLKRKGGQLKENFEALFVKIDKVPSFLNGLSFFKTYFGTN